MAGVGVVPGRLTYREFCGMYYRRHRIQEARDKGLADAVLRAMGQES